MDRQAGAVVVVAEGVIAIGREAVGVAVAAVGWTVKRDHLRKMSWRVGSWSLLGGEEMSMIDCRSRVSSGWDG